MIPLTNYPVLTRKQGQNHITTTSTGEGLTLQGPCSDVTIEILPGTYGTLTGYVELDPRKYIHYVKDECYITAIPDFEFFPSVNHGNQTKQQQRFRIKMKHCITNEEDLKDIRVRHGDIHKGQKFQLVPHRNSVDDNCEMFWEADMNYIIITTTHFSQYLCTTCNKICDTKILAFLTGAIKPLGRRTLAETVLFLCPPQFGTRDYKMVC